MTSALSIAALIAYLVATGWQVQRLARAQRGNARGPAWLALLAVAMHTTVHVQTWLSSGGIALHFFTALSVISLVVAALVAGIALVRPVGALGVVVYPTAAALLLLFRSTRPELHGLPAMDWQIQLHAGLALLAYAALSVAAWLAIMLWLQERALRQRRLDSLLRVFPPLTQVEAMMFRLIGAGFALLTLALMSGVVFVENLFAQHLVHKTVLSLLAWGIFGALLLGRMQYGWRGRRAVRLTLTAMILLGMAFFGSKFVLELILARGR